MKKIAVLCSLLLLAGVGCYDISSDSESCESFRNRPLQNIPVRCYKDLELQDTCYVVNKKMVGKQVVYEVLDKCSHE